MFLKLISALLFVFFPFWLCAKKTPLPFPHPIDIVYLWVDGNDLEWQAIKNFYHQLENSTTRVNPDACSSMRFIDHEELKYSLRSLVAFAPFFRHIYIITMNQRPKWLMEHPQITIIDHKDIFLDSTFLPTFNSHALESNIHRIPGLSEYFIYFNDDVFLGSPLSAYHFFSEKGHPKVLFERGYTVSPNPAVQATLYRKAWVNSNALLDTFFVEEKRRRLCHAPFALRKSFIEETEDLFPDVFQINSSHRFRSDKDYNLLNGLIQYIWMYQGRLEKGKMTNKMISIEGDLHLEQTKTILEEAQKHPFQTFCIQDCMEGDNPISFDLLHAFLESMYPDPAPWEKQD